MELSEEFRYIVRILGTDVDGTLKLPYALAKVKGIGINLGHAITRVLGIDPNIRIGYLSEQQLQRIEEVAKDPKSYGIPDWVLNRRRDPTTGKDMNLYGADLEFVTKEDVRRQITIKSWRGIRHSLGLKVRGQRTRTTGRTGTTIGVSRKEIKKG